MANSKPDVRRRDVGVLGIRKKPIPVTPARREKVVNPHAGAEASACPLLDIGQLQPASMSL